MPDQKPKVFVSFDYDNDKKLRDFIVGQAKLPDSPFEIADWSMKEAAPERDWEEKAEARIKRCDVVIVMVGPKTHSASGVKMEVALARKHKKPIYQIIGYKDSDPTPVPDAGRLLRWNWENLKKLFTE
jgi:nucleoside 2-deoxyribosyltransferase